MKRVIPPKTERCGQELKLEVTKANTRIGVKSEWQTPQIKPINGPILSGNVSVAMSEGTNFGNSGVAYNIGDPVGGGTACSMISINDALISNGPTCS